MKVFKCMSVLGCLLISVLGYCEETEIHPHGVVTNLLTRADLDSVFSSVRISDTNVVLKFHGQGIRYKYTIDRGTPVISKYGESVNLSINQSMRMVSRGIALTIEGFSSGNGQGFLITRKTDLRSLGGGIQVRGALLMLMKNGIRCSPKLVLEKVE